MKLVAKRPCCFGGRKFYIGDEVPRDLVLDPASQEKLGVLSVLKVFAIMQANADEGVRMIAEVTDENILILLHVANSRKTIKNAARERAERLFPAREEDPEAGETADAGTSEGGSAT